MPLKRQGCSLMMTSWRQYPVAHVSWIHLYYMIQSARLMTEVDMIGLQRKEYSFARNAAAHVQLKNRDEKKEACGRFRQALHR